MIKEKLLASIVGGALTFGTVCYTYETFRFEDISHIYNNFDTVVRKYEEIKKNNNELLDKYNNLYNDSIEIISNLKRELKEKEEYIKILEDKLNAQSIVEDKVIESNEVENISQDLDKVAE